MLLTMLYACGGGGDDDGGGPPPSDAALNQFNATLNDVFTAISNAIDQVQNVGSTNASGQNANTRQETINESIACLETGQLTLSGEVDINDPDLTFDLSLLLENCDGLNGALTLVGDVTVTEDQLDSDIVFDGTVSNGCDIEFNAFRERVSADLDTEDGIITLDGSIDSTCGNESFTCDFDGIELTGESDDEELLADVCHLN